MASSEFQAFIDEVVGRNDIVDVISEYTTLKRTGSNLMGLCPLHNDKKSPSLSVSPDKQMFHCFGCGAGGNVIHFIQSAENLDFIDALRLLAQRVKLEMPEPGRGGMSRERQAKIADKKERIYAVNKEAALYFYNNLVSRGVSPGYEYLRDRRITDATIKRFGLGYAPEGWDNLKEFLLSKGYSLEEMHDAGLVKKRDNGTYYDAFHDGRVMFPIIDVRGHVIGFGGRIIKGSDAAKYLNSPETIVFKKKENLFGLNIAKNDRSGKLLLMEGYMDVISLHQSGISNAVASLGTAFTEEQASLVKRYSPAAVLCYDNDEAGKKATIRAGDILLNAGVKTSVLTITDGKDPDEFVNAKGPDMFRVLIEQAKPLIRYKIDEIKQKYNLTEIEGKLEFLEEVTPVLAQIKGLAGREMYISELARELDVSAESIASGVERLAERNHIVDQRREARKLERRRYETQRSIPDNNMKLYNAERFTLSLMTEPKTIKEVLDAGVEADDFICSDIHKRLFKEIVDGYNSGETLSATELVGRFDSDEAKAVSDILIHDKNVRDKEAAAENPLRIILSEKLGRLEENALKSGDQEELQRLFEMKKRLKRSG